MRPLPAGVLPAAVLAAMLTGTGCLGLWVRTPPPIEEMESRQLDMQAALDSLSGAVSANEALLRGLQAQSGSRTTDLVERLTALADELDLVLNRMSQESGPVSQDTTAGPEAQLLFDEAYMQFQQGSFEIAAQGFEEVMGSHPSSALADDAMYYMAVSWEQAGEDHRAVEDLVALHYLYPGSEWAPGALFRAADIYGAHGADADRDRLFGLLLEEYPESDEAALVREMTGPGEVGQP